jgi:hypothetical protein
MTLRQLKGCKPPLKTQYFFYNGGCYLYRLRIQIKRGKDNLVNIHDENLKILDESGRIETKLIA